MPVTLVSASQASHGLLYSSRRHNQSPIRPLVQAPCPATSPLGNLSFDITPSARNKLTSKRMKAKNRDTCQPFFCLSFDSFDSC